MAAELTRQLIERGDIDFVLCFAPSLSVVAGLEKTFADRLGLRFDGRLGAIGGAFTYQGMRGLSDQFWSLLESHRVLVVIDEIHHCAGSELGGTNAWGQEILNRIQHKAAFTLALTGTPWRSDNTPIILAEYSDPEGHIQCDYVYGLKEAVRDEVCRKPRIVLVDNDRLKLSDKENEIEYLGVGDLLNRSDARYQHLLHNIEALRFCLSLGCIRLDYIRQDTPDAGGLVVASSVEHAENIAQILRYEFQKSVSVVTYRQKHSAEIIDRFRNNSQEWIVSVGMISEGTDIPRLQVCCHLSRITTELHFRQVLGRVLRTTKKSKNSAWLYTFAEPTLLQYAQRVAEEVPQENLVSIEKPHNNQPSAKRAIATPHNDPALDLDHKFPELTLCDTFIDITSSPTVALPSNSQIDSLQCIGDFRQRVLDFFQAGL